MTTPATPAVDLQGLDQPNAVARRMRPAVDLCRDLMGGTETVRAKRTTYLPQAPGELAADYTVRLNRSVFFNAFSQTVTGLVGMVFRKDPALDEDVPAAIAEQQAEDIDLEGAHLAVFAKEIFTDAWVAGHGGILVDYPPVGERLTLAEEKARGLRPYWVWYRKEDILSWRTVKENGELVLTQLVLQETAVEPEGAFGERTVMRYRVLRRVITPDGVTITYQLYARGARDELVPMAGGVIRNQTQIPFAPVYSARKTGYLESLPPLLDLGYLNITHYQVMSDHLHALHKASVPILVRIGATGGEDGAAIVVGPNTALDVPMGGDVKYVEHSGAALGQTREQLQDLKADMAILGLRMLQHETRAAETAEAKRIDKAEQDSALSTAARELQDGLERALEFHAAFLGLDEGGSVAVNREFERLQLTGADIDLYAKRVGEGTLSLETLWDIMQRSGHLPEGFDPKLERERIRSSMLPTPGDEDDEKDNDEEEDAEGRKAAA